MQCWDGGSKKCCEGQVWNNIGEGQEVIIADTTDHARKGASETFSSSCSNCARLLPAVIQGWLENIGGGT